MLNRKKAVWGLLFGEELESPLDVNKPENMVRAKVEREREAEEVRKMKGGILFQRLEREIKNGVLHAIQAPSTTNCGCPTCQTIRAINTLLELWVELEKTMEKGEENGH